MKSNARMMAFTLTPIVIVTLTAIVLLLVRNKQRSDLDAEEREYQARLAEVAKNHGDVVARVNAVALLKDQALLTEFASNEKEDAYVRSYALQNLTNQAFLAKIAKNDEDGDVCVAAFHNLTDQVLLLDIAKNSPRLGSRAVAASMLNDRALAEELRKQIDKLRQREGRVKAELWRLEEMTDPAVLADWAKNHEYPEVRQAAEARLNELKKQ